MGIAALNPSYSALVWPFCHLPTISQTTSKAPSEGRAESLRKGLSGMDAARAAMGQGWPFAAGPWSNDGAREPDEVGPDARGKTFCLLLGRLPKVSRRKGGTVSREQHRSGVCTQNQRVTRTTATPVDE